MNCKASTMALAFVAFIGMVSAVPYSTKLQPELKCHNIDVIQFYPSTRCLDCCKEFGMLGFSYTHQDFVTGKYQHYCICEEAGSPWAFNR